MKLGARIRVAREAAGFSQAQLADRVGVAQPTVADWESGKIQPKRHRVPAIAEATGVTAMWLETGTGTPPVPRDASEPVAPILVARPATLPPIADLPRDVPVYGVASGSLSDSFQIEDGIIDYVRRGPGIAGARDVYALYIAGDSMWPRFKPGELVYVSPRRPPKPGDDVIICIKAKAPNEPEQCFIKCLVRRRPDVIEVEQYNPAQRLSYPAAQVIRLHKVLTAGEVLGI